MSAGFSPLRMRPHAAAMPPLMNFRRLMGRTHGQGSWPKYSRARPVQRSKSERRKSGPGETRSFGNVGFDVRFARKRTAGLWRSSKREPRPDSRRARLATIPVSTGSRPAITIGISLVSCLVANAVGAKNATMIASATRTWSGGRRNYPGGSLDHSVTLKFRHDKGGAGNNGRRSAASYRRPNPDCWEPV
jgi:hypothetical protein